MKDDSNNLLYININGYSYKINKDKFSQFDNNDYEDNLNKITEFLSAIINDKNPETVLEEILAKIKNLPQQLLSEHRRFQKLINLNKIKLEELQQISDVNLTPHDREILAILKNLFKGLKQPIDKMLSGRQHTLREFLL